MEELGAVAALSALVLIGLMASGLWIGVALGLTGVMLFYMFGGGQAAQAIGFVAFNALNSYDLVSLPLFIFMASILANCGLSERLYTGSAALFGRLPGGLLHANIFGGALFAAICGSTAATCAAVSNIALPELHKRKYPRDISLASLAAAGTLGPLIPPSTVMIVYGSLTGTSVGRLFMGGVVPGLMLTAMFMTYIALHSLVRRDVEQYRGSLRETVSGLLSIWPVAFLFLLVLGSMYRGIATATEAAAVGTTGAVLVAAAMRGLSLDNLRLALRQATSLSAMIFLIFLGGMLLGHGLSNFGIPQYLASLAVGAQLTPLQLIGILTLVYLILGCFLDGAAMTIMTIPIVFPAVAALGIDPVWFGVLVVVWGEIGAITPPVGVNLFVLQGIAKEPLDVIVRGVFPFVLILLLLELILVVWPELVLFLPRMMF